MSSNDDARDPEGRFLQLCVISLMMSFAAGLGCLPYLVTSSIAVSWIALANSIAGGVMLSSSFNLIYEGQVWLAALCSLDRDFNLP